mmetsp:Transcript_48619/g.138924  ORF Transcript_48619/g.138924 Transcript_48619/m.138924 type:complete len:364 (+) Transcript_48619:103-1194(+)
MPACDDPCSKDPPARAREPVAYPCSFEAAAGARLEDLPQLRKGAWRRIRTLGEAHDGKVYLVEAQVPGAPRALALRRFRREAVIAGSDRLDSAANAIFAAMAVQQLRHPNIAKVFFAAQDDSSFYLASEHCKHGELFAVLQAGGQIGSERAVREVLSQTLRALAALHERGVAHRDVSLESLLLASDGSIRLSDFGQAVLTHAPGEKEVPVPPSSRGLPGKPCYRAPEAERPEPYLASKVDTYACGVLAFTLATGTYPRFSHSSDCWYSKKEPASCPCFAEGLAPQLRALGLEERALSPGLLDLAERLLAPDPGRRPSAREALAHPWLAAAGGGLAPLLLREQEQEKQASAREGRGGPAAGPRP